MTERYFITIGEDEDVVDYGVQVKNTTNREEAEHDACELFNILRDGGFIGVLKVETYSKSHVYNLGTDTNFDFDLFPDA